MSAPANDDLEQARAETRAAFGNRALMYHHIFEAFADEVGPDRAAEVMKRGIARRGAEVGAKYRDAVVARDLDEVGRIFCATSPCGGALFGPDVEEREGDRIVLRMTACPLVDAWRSAGLSEEQVDRLCDIAAAVDLGTFEGAGLTLRFLERRGAPGASRYLLELTLPRE